LVPPGVWRQRWGSSCSRYPQPALFSAQLAVHAAGEHFDQRALFRIGKVETDNIGRFAGRCVIELENRVAGRLEETVACLEKRAGVPSG
jgi:hypothetical protein